MDLNHSVRQSSLSPEINHKKILSWCLYDWANSAFATVITTFIFATYFTTQIAPNIISGTASWGRAMAISGFFIALLGPIIGAIADASGQNIRWLIIFTSITILSSAFLWFALPDPSAQQAVLLTVIIASIAFELSLVFYNALLLQIAPTSHIGRISGWGWALGYLGGLSCLVSCLVLFINSTHPWLQEQARAIRICGPFVAAWYCVFSLPLFIALRKKINLTDKINIVSGIKQLWHSLHTLKAYPAIIIFLFARMLYTDGINTIFMFGGIYAAGSFGFGMREILLFGISLNITAGIGAFLFAYVDDHIGSKKTILLSLVNIILLTSVILFLQSKLFFWIVSLLLGIFFGPVQAASRSFMARLTPPEYANEMFGLYALSGKITAFLSPWLLSVFTLYFNNQRAGLASILLFLIAGFLGLLCVNKDA